MATSDRYVEPAEQQSETRATGPDLSRYDVVLVAIPLAFFSAVLFGHLSPISVQVAIGLGAVFSAIAVVDALFVNPPRPGQRAP
ncbi:hypothetical protein [Halapricum desulfuricans]|uniref:Putative membrane protein n=1 Tax=Halapricum desulfuricans TaxID=2841257 RepID=A0A897N8N5_9EURY|nr:hypothetical protein [Halapricum desulfuricans]QSG08864.1 putative membrane protein [Halapricum desulfuricans]QSG11799.1 putative membrane protein [Halapricum desulfuricans]